MLLQEVRGSLEEPDGASEIKANDPPAEVTSADRDDGREVSKVARRPYVGYQREMDVDTPARGRVQSFNGSRAPFTHSLGPYFMFLAKVQHTTYTSGVSA